MQEFKSGDRVITFTAPETVEKRGDDAFASVMELFSMLGQGADGTLRSFGVFSEKALVHAPASLDWLPAATLTCNWSTAWNCLFGLEGKTAGPGKWILVQGTGGVAVAVLQVAVAAGAVVVATTSTEEKEARLKKLGASHTINYRSSPDDWEQKARSLTPEGRGFDIVVDVGGNETLGKSLAAVRVDGLVLVIGGVGISAAPVPLFSILLHNCVARGMLGGSRAQLKEAVRFIDEKGIKPAVDDVVFELEDALDAYKRLHSRKHFAKVVIRISHAED